MAYILLFTALVCWAAIALRDRPLQGYAPLYFIAAAGGSSCEFILSRVLRFYEYNWAAIPHPHDFALMGFFVTLGIDALFVVLYLRYSREQPVMLSLLWAALIMVLEVLFVRVGAMFYPRGWHPVLSGLITVGAMLGARWLDSVRIPAWAHIDAMAFWLAFLVDILLHGVLKLYYFHLPLGEDPWPYSRILAFLLSAFLFAPLATLVTLGPWWRQRRWLMVVGAALLLTGAEAAGRAAGFVIYTRWNLGLSGLQYLAFMGLPVLYARWYTAAK